MITSMEGWTGVGALGSLVFMVVIMVYYFYPTWKVRHIPVPPYTWFLGHIPLLTKHQALCWTMLAKDYGPMYRFHVGRQPMVMVTDAELCRQVGLKLFKQVPNRSNPAMIEGSSVLKKALFFSRDEQWSGMKSILQPLFHSDKMNNYTPIMTQIVDELLERLRSVKEGEDVNISRLFQRLTLDVIGEVAFGIKFGLVLETPGPDEWLVQTTVKSIDALRMDAGAGVPLSTIVGTFFPILQKPFRSLLRMIPGTPEWVADGSDHALKLRLRQIQQEREELMRRNGSVSRVDSLSLLLNSSKLNKQNGKLLTQDYIGALTYELTLVGSETSSVTLSMLTYLLALHPECERKMLAEIDAFGPRDLPITTEDLETKFPYVDMVIKETMRKHTTTPVVAREASEDIELGGYHLPKGTWVWLVLEALQMNPKDFPEPEEFRPERFDENCDEAKTRHPYAFLPFGVGPRSCLGKRFAAQEVKLTVVRLYQNFTFTLSPLTKVPLETQFGIVVRPKHGVCVRVHPRWTRL
ncbi:hypothetical protein Mapa_005334 [Marchantia paleacea]|uniref:Cytochrome P450 CYP711A n=1 Tax=Marchantia paleacea subsp. diptera TaxID=93925 RepID=A0A8D4XJ04_MARPA|nr:hypothetical protein Mapa_005334 [Marchantia paleacea]BCG55903.1 cytochrome P450 CYP711A [Marchantia paleacea subsp. diptera]